jgi:hypothetical protein
MSSKITNQNDEMATPSGQVIRCKTKLGFSGHRS